MIFYNSQSEEFISLRERTVLYLNAIIIFTICFSLLMIIQGLITTGLKLHSTFSQALVGNIIVIVCNIISYILNNRKKYLLSRILYLVVLNIFAVWSTINFGRFTGFNLYLIVAAIVPLAIISKYNVIKLTFISMSILCLLGTEIYFFVFNISPKLEEAALHVSYLTSIILVPILLLIILFIILKTNSLVEEWLILEEDRSKSLLENILPKSIIRRLKKGEVNIAQTFTDVSVLFFDIVGFTAKCSKVEAKELVQELNQIFTKVDHLISIYKLEKIKTIGDAYLIASGIPEENVNNLSNIVNFAFELNDLVNSLSFLGDNFQIRTGISYGKVIGGIIGKSKYTYDIWGDTVNLASRLESSGTAGKIHVSQSVYDSLKNKYTLTKSEIDQLKNIGKVSTYFISKP